LKNLYWKEKGKIAWRMNIHVLEKKMPEILGALPEGEVLTPTLFIRGALSNYIEDEDIPLIEDQFPDSEVETIENAGHWVHAESPGDFLDTLLSFCVR
jgi:pimeloyl-ACP methyl ester carboxylesterase